MATKTYEAAVKLSTGQVVVYHNINTGLYKFHRFLTEKFSGEQRWLYYKVRRKSTKEIVGYYRNSLEPIKIELIRLYLKPICNEKGTGYFIPITYIRNGYDIVRNLFVAKSQIENVAENHIVIPKKILEIMIEKGREDLYQYYLKNHHQLDKEDIRLGKILFDKQIKEIEGRAEEFPVLNFP